MTSGLYLPEEHPDVVNGHRDIDPVEAFMRNAFQHGEVFQPGV